MRRNVMIAMGALMMAAALPARADLSPDQALRIREAAPPRARVQPEKDRRVLIWNTPYMESSPHKGYTIPQGAFAMKTLGEKTGAFEAVISDDQTLLLPENVKQFDAFIMNNSCGPWTTPTDEAMPKFAKYGSDKTQIEKLLRRSFLDWVRAGGGVVAYHYSIGAARHWPELENLLGARCGGHPWNEEVGVKLDDPDHPLLDAFDGKNFRITEEVFQYLDPYSRDKLKVLLSIDTKTTNMKVKWLKRTDNDYALAWIKSYGSGRVFYSEFGHRTEIWWNPTIMRFYLDAIQFATGDLPVNQDETIEAAENGAFATIGPALVSGNFHQYPPFYSSVIAPHAVVVERKVFCAFQDTKGRPVVMAYDTAEKSWAGPVHASDFGLGKDAHGNPSICIDQQGYIHIFHGCHGGQMRYARSRNRLDIGEWRQQPAPTPRATYPQSMLMADGSIFIFYRAGGHMSPWTFRLSSDGGRTWSDGGKIIEMRLAPPDPLAAAYCSFHPGRAGKTVHCFWVHKDDNAARVRGEKKHPWRPLKHKGLHEAVYRYNMYYVRRDADGTWRNVSGNPAELPVSKAFADEHCLVFDSGDEFTNIGMPMVDSANRPYVRFRYGVGDWKAGGTKIVPWKNKFADCAAGRWQVYDDVPRDWPEEVRVPATAAGPAAYGDTTSGRWFIYYRNDRYNPKVATSIFLEHETLGYATREGGPAKLP